MSKPLRIVVMGAGRMGQRRIAALNAHQDALLVGIAESNAASAKSIWEKWKVPGYLNWEESVAAGAEAAVICLPNDLHAPAARAALKSGLHVFCEKPLALGVEEAETLVSAARDAGRSLVVGSNLMFFPNVLAAEKLLEEGAIGLLLSARAWIGHGGGPSAAPWYSQSERAGGGALIDVGIHLLSWLRRRFGGFAEARGLVDSKSMEENAFCLLRSTQGGLVSLHASRTEPRGYFEVVFTGRSGQLRVDGVGSACALEIESGGKPARREDFSSLPRTSFEDEIADFLRIAAGPGPFPDGSAALEDLRVVESVYESSETGKSVIISA